MALFIANLAFSPSLLVEAKLGIFAAAVVSAAAGLALLGTRFTVRGTPPCAQSLPCASEPRQRARRPTRHIRRPPPVEPHPSAGRT
jgi:hypothetical protein